MLGKCERRLWKQQEHGGYGIPEWLAGSKRVQVKGGMLLLAAYPWKTPPGKAVQEPGKEGTMGSENAKVRVGIYIEKAILEQADGLLETANVRSRNEFVAEALKFYMGYLLAGKAENYFLQSLASVLTGTVQDSENRLARMDFKIAVELSKLSQVIAYTHDVDEESLNRLHVKCVDEVRRINGTVKFEDAYHYQKRDV